MPVSEQPVEAYFDQVISQVLASDYSQVLLRETPLSLYAYLYDTLLSLYSHILDTLLSLYSHIHDTLRRDIVATQVTCVTTGLQYSQGLLRLPLYTIYETLLSLYTHYMRHLGHYRPSIFAGPPTSATIYLLT